MGIQNIKPMWSGDDTEASSDVAGNNRQRSARLMWSITPTAPETDNAVTIHQELAGMDAFKVGAGHPYDNQMYATSFRVGRYRPGLFLVEGQYVSPSAEIGENPLDDPADVEVDFSTEQTEYDTDITGAAFANAAGEPYTVVDEISDLMLVVTRNLPAFDYMLAWQYMNRGAVNSDVFLGFAAGTCRMRGLQGTRIATGPFLYWRVTGRVQVRSAPPGSSLSKAWYSRVRNEGFRARPEGGGAAVEVRLLKNGPGDVSRPVLLNADGTYQPNPAAATWIERPIAPTLAFASLGFF